MVKKLILTGLFLLPTYASAARLGGLKADADVLLSTAGIKLQDSLQSGATFYVSSGTVNGQFKTRSDGTVSAFTAEGPYGTEEDNGPAIFALRNTSPSAIGNRSRFTLQSLVDVFGTDQADDMVVFESSATNITATSARGSLNIYVKSGASLVHALTLQGQGAGTNPRLVFEAGTTDPAFDWTTDGELDLVAGDLQVAGQSVCREDGTNCPASGSGDVVLAATQTFTGSNTFKDIVVGSTFTVSIATTIINGVTYYWTNSVGSGSRVLTTTPQDDGFLIDDAEAITDAAQLGEANVFTTTNTFAAGSTIAVQGLLQDVDLSPGTSGYVFTSRGSALAPQWLPGGSGSGDAVLAATQTFTGSNTFSPNMVTISTGIRGVTRIEWSDGTVQVSSPPAGGAGSMPEAVFEWAGVALHPVAPDDAIPPPNNDAGTNIDQLTADFHQGVDQCRTAPTFRVPTDIDTSGTVTFYAVTTSSLTTGDFMVDYRHNAGVAEGTDPDLALTTEAAAADTVQGTGGQITVTEWTETVSNLGWAAGDFVDSMFCRDADNGSDDLDGRLRLKVFGIRVPQS